MEESKKNGINKILVGIIAVLLIAVIGLGSFVVGTQFGEKEEEKETDNNEEVELEKLDVNSAVVKKLFEIFREDTNCTKMVIWAEESEINAKKYIAYLQLKESDFVEETCGSLDDSFVDGHYCAINDASYIFYGVNEYQFEEAIKNETTRTISASALEAKYKELFGQNAEFENGSFRISEGPIAYYDKTNKLYAEFSCECGGECAGSTQTLDGTIQEGKKLTLETTITDYDNESTKIDYTFEYEEESGNYIFVSRVEK